MGLCVWGRDQQERPECRGPSSLCRKPGAGVSTVDRGGSGRYPTPCRITHNAAISTLPKKKYMCIIYIKYTIYAYIYIHMYVYMSYICIYSINGIYNFFCKVEIALLWLSA